MTPITCDTVEGIETYLAHGLIGLTRLLHDRELLAAPPPAGLTPYVILGRFWLGENGGIELIEPADPDLPPIVHADGYVRRHPTITRRSTALPTFTARCAWCDRGWSLDTVHDTQRHDGRDGFWHRQCAHLHTLSDHAYEFAQCLSRIEVPALLRPIPNQKYLHRSDASPWFRVMTGPLLGLVLGWRKSVVEIDWSACTFQLDAHTRALFAAEATTFLDDRSIIHAHTYDKVSTYLAQLAYRAQLVAFTRPTPEAPNGHAG